jgi:phosphoglycolate phosphatase
MQSLQGALREAELLVFDKDGVLLNFDAMWGTLTALRVEALCAIAKRDDLTPKGLALLGLNEARTPVPDGLLTVGTRLEALIAAGLLLHQHGFGWAAARAIAETAFKTADDALDFERCCLPLPGVLNTLKQLKQQGHRLAIATSDTSLNAWRFLKLTGLETLFDAVVGADQVARSKPRPDLFLSACEQTGTRPEMAVMIGDSPVDLLMGRAAEAFKVIGVLSGVGSRENLEPHADWIIDDVNALL